MKIYKENEDTITILELVARAPQNWLDEIVQYEVTDTEAFFLEELCATWFDGLDFNDLKEFSLVDGVISTKILFNTTANVTEYIHFDGWTEDYAEVDDSWEVSHNVPKDLIIEQRQYLDQ
jgi:hypothetical protein